MVFFHAKFMVFEKNGIFGKNFFSIGDTISRIPHLTVEFGHWLEHIRVQYLVLCSTTSGGNIWSRVEPH